MDDLSNIVDVVVNVETPRPIMAICTDGNRCGCAIYCDGAIQLVADRRDTGDPYKGLDIVIQKMDPEYVIISTVQKRLIQYLEKRLNNEIVLAPNQWFSLSQGQQKLIDSELVGSRGFKNLEEKTFFVTSRVNKSIDICALRAISAIDKFLIHKHVQSDGQIVPYEDALGNRVQTFNPSTEPQPDNLMPILDVRYIDPGPVLSIDKFTFLTLGIFSGSAKKPEQEDDPEVQYIPSLYDVLNLCQSPQGKKTLRTMMMWPLQELEELQHRHETLDFFLRPQNKMFREQITIHLRNVVPLSGLLAKISQSVGTYKELSIIYKALWAFMAIIDLIKQNGSSEIEILNRITFLDCPEMRATVESIVNIVDFEASKREKRVQVCLGVDETVDEKKEVVKNLMKLCDEVAVQETAKYKDVLGKTCRVLYIPRIGFLNSIDYTSTAELHQIELNKEFDILLHTEQSIYFKTARMEELDCDAGDIACDLIDVQESVIVQLQGDILKHTEVILRLMDLCGELDCLISFAVVSFQRGYTRPELLPPNEEIDIRDAYHPLHSLRTNIVPNDVRFHNEKTNRPTKMMVITGPNSCGKTTYMKAACLAVYMAHIGCFVPASSARIPIVDAILTRMHSPNSISTGLSSFATDLRQVNYALDRATSRSLIAIDEFGKGTQARDGFHLLKGLVAYLTSKGQNSPYVMVATHFNRLINHLQNFSEHILYKTFKVTRDPRKDSIVYEFRLKDGVSESSLADQVATRAGVPQAIIDRANQIRDYITEGRPIRPRPPTAA